MSLIRKISGIVAVLVAAQLSAFSAEIAVLRNGFTINFDHRQQMGKVTRLFTASGFVDIPTSDIASFEKDDTPPPPPVQQPQVAATSVAVPQTAQSLPASNQQTSVANGNVVTPQPAVLPVAAKIQQPAQAVAQPVDINALVLEASSRHQLDPDFVASVIKAESDFNIRARSPKGALGLMQLMPQTASQLGVKNPFDARENVEAGTAHLSALLDMYHNDAIKALAAYNAGAHRVEQYHGVPPYFETRAYVAKIVRDFNAKKRAEMKTLRASSPAGSKTKTAAKTAPVHKPKAKPQPQRASAAKPVKPA